MSAVAGEEPKHEIIIVKRGHGDHDEGHHGGVWKIAFADFMTAMMCFFLVMWLINAANEETKAAVASYFNPVKLIDRNSSKKGLEDLGDGPHDAGMTADDAAASKANAGESGRGNAGPATEADASNAAQEQAKSDKNLFANPYAVLSEIAAETGKLQNVSAKGDGGAQAAGPSTGASGGESYRDPFAPDFWSQEVAADQTAEASPANLTGNGENDNGEKDMAAAMESAEVEAVKPKPADEGAVQELADPVKAEDVAKAPEAIKDGKPSAETVKAADAIRQQLDDAFKPGDTIGEGISVIAGERGVTIQITDQLESGMFEIGSAVPRREMVLAMEKVGKVLSQQRGSLIISGHTDGRPFRNAVYDNWRLSTARAHSAYYMLARTGLDEGRIVEVAGYADRRLKNKADPLSATNRRIEILLERAE